MIKEFLSLFNMDVVKLTEESMSNLDYRCPRCDVSLDHEVIKPKVDTYLCPACRLLVVVSKVIKQAN